MRNEGLSRRHFIQNILSGLGTFMLCSCGQLSSVRRIECKRPNILFLLTDDQRWDALGCAGNSIIHTPNIDDLAKKGVLFTNTFVTTSICASSRASILSGQYTCRHGIADFATSFSEEALSRTYPILLRQGGYRIGFVGKYGVGRGQDFPADKFDFWRGCPGQCDPYERKDESGNYRHLTKIMADQAIEFLRTCSKNQPFCLSVSFKAPHAQDGDPRQFVYDPAYEDLYQNVTIPKPKTATDHHLKAMPGFLQADETIARTRWHLCFDTPEKYQKMVKGYYRLITGVDTAIGKIREELVRMGLSGNTIIIFSSDNGFFLGEHGFSGKWYAYEESIRVPLIIYDPRRLVSNHSQRREEIALNIDLAPTILSLVGESIPDCMQGCDLTPLLKDRKVRWRKDFLYEHALPIFRKKTGESYDPIPLSEGVVASRYKYIRYIDYQYEELYDLKIDPCEENNLANARAYSAVLKTMRERYKQLKESCK